MESAAGSKCQQHPDRWDCPDALITYSTRFDEYGIIIHDGGTSKIAIYYCPWCGSKLPESQSNRWFDELEALGFLDPFDDDIPEQYKDDRWRKQKQNKPLLPTGNNPTTSNPNHLSRPAAE